MEVQIFGVKNDADTRKALRFFKERRVKVNFVDLKQRDPSPGELRRFFQRFGEDRLIDRSAKRFRTLGLGSAHYGEERWLEIQHSLAQLDFPKRITDLERRVQELEAELAALRGGPTEPVVAPVDEVAPVED